MMKLRLAIIVASATFAMGSAARAETCQLHSSDTQAGAARDVRVYDERTNKVVWSGLVNGGQTISVTVSEDRASFDYKYPLDRDYHSKSGFWCKDGESTNF